MDFQKKLSSGAMTGAIVGIGTVATNWGMKQVPVLPGFTVETGMIGIVVTVAVAFTLLHVLNVVGVKKDG